MAVWEYARPGGNPRVGILRFETTRGDRLFVSLLGSGIHHLAWLGLVGANLWWAVALSVIYAVGVFPLRLRNQTKGAHRGRPLKLQVNANRKPKGGFNAKASFDTTAAMLLAFTGSAFAGMDEAKQFLDKEVGDMSSLDRAAQEAEMQWFVDAAKPFAAWRSRSFPKRSPRMNTNRRCSHRPLPRSPASDHP